MKNLKCPACGERSDDGRVCEHCDWNIKQGLNIIVNWWPDLFYTITRQTRTTPRSEGHGLHHEKPLPFDAPAAELANEVRHTLVQWVRLTVDEFGAAYPRDRMSAMADHLRDWTGKLRGHAAAVDYVHEIGRLADRVMKAIDTADGQLVHVPRATCPVTDEAGRCGGELVAAIRRDWFAESFLRCQSCGRTWAAAEWEQVRTDSDRLDDAEDAALDAVGDVPGPIAWATPQEFARRYGVAVVTLYNAAARNGWERRKVGRQVIYSVRDVLRWRAGLVLDKAV